MISEYFKDFTQIVSEQDFIESSEIRTRKLNDFLGVIEAKIVFETGILHVLEVIIFSDNKTNKKKYKYHFQKLDNSLIFRYDNAPHHHNSASFPHHKHFKSEIFESREPDISQILSEIKTML